MFTAKTVFILGAGSNWCRFVIHKLVTGCANGADLLRNVITFISFNYDVSFDRQLWHGLTSLQQFDDVAEEFLTQNSVLHIYGKIHDDPREELATDVDWKLADARKLAATTSDRSYQIWLNGEKLLNAAYRASKGIDIIAPDKAVTNDAIESAKAAIAEANCVYILGYGFDGVNNKLLDLPRSLNGRYATEGRKTIQFTNYKNRGVVNKNASKLFFDGDPGLLLEERNQVVRQWHCVVEKSIGTAYDALAYDFDSPEEHSS